MNTLTVTQAKDYLTADPSRRLRVIVGGKTRRIFYNSDRRQFGLFLSGSRSRGRLFDWSEISRILAPAVREPGRLTAKFIRKAGKASFTNRFIRRCLAADPARDPYANGLTTGTSIDGDIITLGAVGRAYPGLEAMFRQAFSERREWNSGRYPYRGYDLSLSVRPVNEDDENGNCAGDVWGYLSLEYRGCGNGYYYTLVNDGEFIGIDID